MGAERRDTWAIGEDEDAAKRRPRTYAGRSTRMAQEVEVEAGERRERRKRRRERGRGRIAKGGKVAGGRTGGPWDGDCHAAGEEEG